MSRSQFHTFASSSRSKQQAKDEVHRPLKIGEGSHRTTVLNMSWNTKKNGEAAEKPHTETVVEGARTLKARERKGSKTCKGQTSVSYQPLKSKPSKTQCNRATVFDMKWRPCTPRSDEGSSSLPTDQGKLETTPINAAHGWAELEAEKEKPEEFVFAPSEPAKGHKYYQQVKRRSVKVARSPVFDMCWNPATPRKSTLDPNLSPQMKKINRARSFSSISQLELESLSSRQSSESTDHVSTLVFGEGDENNLVVEGTIQDLMNELFAEDHTPDHSYVYEFLATFRYFIQPKDLFWRVKEHFSATFAEDDATVTPNIRNLFSKRIRILNFIKHWMLSQFHDVENDPELFTEVLCWLKETVNPVHPVACTSIFCAIQEHSDIPMTELVSVDTSHKFVMRVIVAAAALEANGFKKRDASEFRSGSETGRYKVQGDALLDWVTQHVPLPCSAEQYCQSLMNEGYLIKESDHDNETFENGPGWYILNDMQQKSQQAFPKPLFKAEFGVTAFSFMDINSREIARQLTLIDCNLIRQIPLAELQAQKWAKDPASTPQINAVVNRFNLMSNWIVTKVVTTQNLTARATLLKKIINVLGYMKEYNNFMSIFSLLSGLENSSVSRLKKTWKNVPKKQLSDLATFKNQFRIDDNYAGYREILQEANLPIVPFIGLHLKDLTFIEDGNSTVLPNGNINFRKLRLIAKVFHDILHYQTSRYGFEPVLALQNYFRNIVSLDESRRFELSYQCEPRHNRTVSVNE